MAHAPAPPVPEIMLAPPDSGYETAVERGGVSLWLLGLTAIALVFTALLSLALAARSSGGSAAGELITGIAVLASGIGIFALGYVLIITRRMGLFDAIDRPGHADDSSAGVLDGLRVAPIVLPRMPLDPSLRMVPGRPRRKPASQSEAARQEPATAVVPPQQAAPAEISPPAPAARPTPAARATPRARPARTSTPRPVMPAPPRPALPAGSSQAQAATLQVRVASLRTPPAARGRQPDLVHRLRGQGTYRTFLPPAGPVAPVTRSDRVSYPGPTPVWRPIAAPSANRPPAPPGRPPMAPMPVRTR